MFIIALKIVMQLSTLDFDWKVFNSTISRLLLTIANSLDQDQDQQNVCHDLDPNRLTL